MSPWACSGSFPCGLNGVVDVLVRDDPLRFTSLAVACFVDEHEVTLIDMTAADTAAMISRAILLDFIAWVREI